MDDTLNIVVVGKSGVGKSSFLNYLLGQELYKTGIGEPVTKTYFDKREMPADDQGVKYVLYDTKGIEPTTTKECIENIFKEIDERDKYPNFFEWIHSIYYCFDSTAARVEPLEYKFINNLSKKVSVIVLLTKSDTVDRRRIDALSKEIRSKTSPSVLIIPVCSIESKGTRKNPTPVHQFGREDVKKASFYGLWNKVATVIPYKSVSEIQKLINEIEPISFSGIDTDCSYKKDKFDALYRSKERNEDVLKKVHDKLKSMSVNPSKEVYDKVVEFYKKVNRFSPQLFFLTESQDAFNDMKNYDPTYDITNIKASLDRIYVALKELSDCWFWDNAESKVLGKEVEQYQEMIKDIKKRLNDKVERFVSNYKAELLQYGRLCISNENVESDFFDSINDLSKDECLYAKMVEFAISTGHSISVDERSLLDKLREELKLSEFKAGRIEDFLRSEKMTHEFKINKNN